MATRDRLAARLPGQGLPRHRRRSRRRRASPGLVADGVGDREWMVVDGDRPLPHAARAAAPRARRPSTRAGRPASRGARTCAACDVADSTRAGDARDVVVWRSDGARLDCGDAAADWLSDWLARDVRLVRFDRARTRACNPRVRGRLGRAHDVRRRLSGARHRHRLRSPSSTRASPRAATRRCR